MIRKIGASSSSTKCFRLDMVEPDDTSLEWLNLTAMRRFA
jgi:hypothetical protein